MKIGKNKATTYNIQRTQLILSIICDALNTCNTTKIDNKLNPVSIEIKMIEI